jgi:peroxiredoxin
MAVLYGTAGHSKRTWWVRRDPWEVVRVLQEGPAPGMGMEWVTHEMLRDAGLEGVSFDLPEGYEVRDVAAGKAKRKEEGKRKRAAHREALFGQPAPDFEAPDLDGETVRLSDLRGKVVLVNFWGTWCIPCMAEIPELQKIQDRHRDAGFVILAIDHEPEPLEDPEAPRKTMERLGASLRVVPATDEIMDAYIPPHYPTNVLVDREGIVRYLSSGYEPGEEKELEEEIRKLL